MLFASPVSFVPRLLAIAASLAATFVLVQAPAEGATRASVTGIVTGATSGNPGLAGIQACAVRYSESGDYQNTHCAVTRSDGRYTLKLAPGKYAFFAYEQYLYGGWAPQRFAGGKIIRVGSSRVVDFRLTLGAKITGQLRTPVGGPPGDNVLSVYAFAVDSRGKAASMSESFSNVAEGGYFEISKLPAGRYALQVTDGNSVFANQWFPNSATAIASTVLSVAAGQHSTGHDMTLTPGSALVLSLTGSKGKGEAGNVELYDASGSYAASADTSAKGVVKFTGLFPGQYRVRGTAYAANFTRWYSGKKSLATANPINVAANSTTKRTFQLRYPTLKAKKRATVRIDANSVTAKPPKWKKKARNNQIIWYRDGKRLNRNGYDHILTRKSDVGHRIKACYIAMRTGYADGRSCSKYTRKITMY